MFGKMNKDYQSIPNIDTSRQVRPLHTTADYLPDVCMLSYYIDAREMLMRTLSLTCIIVMTFTPAQRESGGEGGGRSRIFGGGTRSVQNAAGRESESMYDRPGMHLL